MNFSEMRHLVQPNEAGEYTGKISGSQFVIGPGKRGDTWTVKVADKVIVTETDDEEHAWNQAKAYAEQVSFNICGPQL
jgi:hypothetical protein